MLKKKQEIITVIAFTAFVILAVMIKSNTINPESVDDGLTVTPQIPEEELFYQSPDLVSNLKEEEILEEVLEPDTILPLMPTRMSFGQAFATARMEWGPGVLFTWNGLTYTTSYAKELVKEETQISDSGKVNIVLNTIKPNKKVEE